MYLMLILLSTICSTFFYQYCSGKNVEGHLKTLDDWAFLARFCFLSGRGRYEYHIEFERRYGDIQLLLYYDDKTQWPSVYKSGKTCQQKLQVLSVVDNQIVTLSARTPFNILSGCTLHTKYHQTSTSSPSTTTTTEQPTNINREKIPISSVTKNPTTNYDSTYYDKFLYTTTESEQQSTVTDPTSSLSSAVPINNHHYWEQFDLLNEETNNNNNVTEINMELFDTELFQLNFTSSIDNYLINDTAAESMSWFLNQSLFLNRISKASSSSSSLNHDIVEKNLLENTTDYLKDIEELFPQFKDDDHDEGGEDLDDDQLYRIRRTLIGEKTKGKQQQIPSGPAGIPNKKQDRGTIIVSCSNVGGFTSSRERWWYIAVANCGSGKGLDIKYKFRMTNGPPGDFWHEHFSADEMYIPPILFSSCMSYTFLLIAIFLCAMELKTLHLFHCTYRLFGMSAILQWIGILCQGIAWTKYGLNGLGPQTTLGSLFMGASEITFLCVLLLMAKGYTITRARLSSCSTIKMTIFVNCYIIVYVSLFIYQAEAFDPGEVLNLYESPAGFGLAGLRCASWFAFLYSTGTTIRKYPEKQHFYYPFGLLGSLWILGGPLLTIIGIAMLDAWVRESIMCATSNTLAFGGHMTFLYLTWPSRANKSFPYHVRTNHVGIASNEDDGADYPRHTYSPSVADQNIIIPLTRRTEELLSGVYNQYFMENELYNSQTTPHSHISFPTNNLEPASDNATTATNTGGPTQEQQHQQHVRNTTIANNSDDETIVATNNRKQNIQKLTTSANTEINGDDQFIDSGHPSLENDNLGVSLTNAETIPTSAIERMDIGQRTNVQSPVQQQPSELDQVTTDDRRVNGKLLKNNPFIVSNGIKRIPNKVILEPIDQPIRMAMSASNETTSGGMSIETSQQLAMAKAKVPKHLFVIKKSSS